MQPDNDALLLRVGVDQAGLDPLAVQLDRTGVAGSGGGSRQGGSQGGKIDGHRWQEAREQKRGLERPRPRSTSAGRASAMTCSAQSRPAYAGEPSIDHGSNSGRLRMMRSGRTGESDGRPTP